MEWKPMCEETLVLTEALGSFTRTQHGKDKKTRTSRSLLSRGPPRCGSWSTGPVRRGWETGASSAGKEAAPASPNREAMENLQLGPLQQETRGFSQTGRGSGCPTEPLPCCIQPGIQDRALQGCTVSALEGFQVLTRWRPAQHSPF